MNYVVTIGDHLEITYSSAEDTHCCPATPIPVPANWIENASSPYEAPHQQVLNMFHGEEANIVWAVHSCGDMQEWILGITLGCERSSTWPDKRDHARTDGFSKTRAFYTVFSPFLIDPVPSQAMPSRVSQ